MSKEEADSFLKEVFTDRRFGEGRLLVEEFLTGPEVSIFGALVDDHYLILCPARDYKRLKEGDAGPNTGGMGAVASRRLVEPEMLERIEKEIVAPTVAGLKKDGLPYRGFLYFGLMLTPNGPKVIEYNCRFGDPECQAVMPLLSGDLASFCLHGAKGEFGAGRNFLPKRLERLLRAGLQRISGDLPFRRRYSGTGRHFKCFRLPRRHQMECG